MGQPSALGVLGQIGAIAAFTGADGLKMEAIAKSLGVVEGVISKITDKVKINAEDFTLLGSVKYWDGILGKMKDANQSLGIAGNLGMNLQSSFRGAYASVVEMGITDEKLAKSVESYFQKSGRAQILSANQMSELAKMTHILGEESMDIVMTYGNMGLGIENSTKRMRNLIKESDKFGVLPTKVSGILKANIDAVNKYSFKNGVKALEQMAIYAAKTNTDLKSAFGVADKILQGGIEGTMEMSTELQLLGGSFGNMGNFSEMIYLARNEPEKFAEMFNKAAADMAEFNEETGEIKYSAYSMDIFRKVAQATGYEMDDLVKGGQSLKKSMMIGNELDSSLKGLKNYEALLTKVSGAAFKNEAGDWVVKMKQDGKEIEKAVSALTEDQIKQISFTDETKGPEAAFENIAKSNERLDETLNRLIETLKVEALSTAGYEEFNRIARTAAENIKETAKPFIDIVKDFNKGALENATKVLDPLAQGNVTEAVKAAGSNLADAGGMLWGVTKDVGQILYNVFANAAKFLAAGLEWGFKRGVVHLQNGFIAAYNATPLATTFGKAEYIKPTKEESFSEILGTYDLKGILSGTEFEKWWTDFSKSNPAPNTTTQSTTTTNAPVENKPVPEVKKETEAIEKKLENNKDVSKVEVSFKNPMELNVDGLTYNVDGKYKKEIIEKTVRIITGQDGINTNAPIDINEVG